MKTEPLLYLSDSHGVYIPRDSVDKTIRLTIPKGTGFNVGTDFYRAPHDMALSHAFTAALTPGITYGYIAPLPDAPVAFMRRGATSKGVLVAVQTRLIRSVQK